MHIALIPDGNRRYMAKKNINLLDSYDQGIRKFYDFVEWCSKLEVDELTLYALSLENISNRGEDEIETLFSVFNSHALDGMKEPRIHDNKVRINICGDKQQLLNNGVRPELAKEVFENLQRLEESTKGYDRLKLNLAIAYGGRQEILEAAKKVVESGMELTEDSIKDNLWVKDYPDILIRTAEDRISNFLLWQSAYSEIYFVEKLWQEFTEEDLNDIVSDFRTKERRYGK
ncbi:MAG: polyprenyl diphosphate synthase [Candidatus Altiarchaeota archaeon]